MMTYAIRMTFSAAILSAMSSLFWQAEANAQAWPNEPANSTLITDWPFTTLIGDGWFKDSGSSAIVSDATAPSSPSTVARFTYNIGFSGGGGPDNIAHSLPGATKLYASLWWKPSSNWQAHPSGINKIAFVFNGAGDVYIAMYSLTNPWSMHLNAQSSAGADEYWAGEQAGTTLTPLVPGNWYQLEWLLDKDAKTIKVWINGALNINATGVVFQNANFGEFQIAPTWGGIGSQKTQQDYYDYDHVRISIPNDVGTTVLTPPRNLRVN